MILSRKSGSRPRQALCQGGSRLDEAITVKQVGPFADIRFVVDRVWANSADVIQKSGPPLDITHYDPAYVHLLICASISPGIELKLIADPILNHIGSSGGPLNADPLNPGAACVASKNSAPFMTPTNLPALTFKKPKKPPSMADVIGIYEGGGHYTAASSGLPAAAL